MKASRPLPHRTGYRPPRGLRETPPVPPGEMEVQALWFEQLCQPVLATDDGRKVEIVQPGFWNHQGGPDFTRAVIRFREKGAEAGEITVGNVEVHLHPADWHAHGHHADPAYDDTILHVVWEAKGGKAFFPATSSFKRVPQVMLSSQLLAPWAELQPLCASLLRQPLPGAVPGTLFTGHREFAAGRSLGNPARGGVVPVAAKGAALVLAPAGCRTRSGTL